MAIAGNQLDLLDVVLSIACSIPEIQSDNCTNSFDIQITSFEYSIVSQVNYLGQLIKYFGLVVMCVMCHNPNDTYTIQNKISHSQQCF